MKYWRVGVKIETPGTLYPFITDIMAVAITPDDWYEGHIQREIEKYDDVKEYHGVERSDISILDYYPIVRYDFVSIKRDKQIDSILT
jgi:hypothetical protein